MARIAFVPFREFGHLQGPFALARKLRDRGHTPLFLVNSSDKEICEPIQDLGFEVIPFWPSPPTVSPVGPLRLPGALRSRLTSLARRLAPVEGDLTDGDPEHLLEETLLAVGQRRAPQLVNILTALKTIEAQQLQWFSFAKERAHAELQRHALDALLVDHLFAFLVLSGRQIGLPAAPYLTCLPFTRDRWAPPCSSSLVPRRDTRWRLQVELAWLFVRLKMASVRGVMDLLNFHLHFVTCNTALVNLYRELCKRVGLDFDKTVDMSAQFFDLKMPSLVFCPRSLDFDRVQSTHYNYAETMVDLDRPESAFDWGQIDDSRQLVYCALGSQVARVKGAEQFFREVIKLLGARPHLQGVVAIGHDLDPSQFGELPPNVLVVQFAPQLGMLKRARLMITHGGMGSIKECVLSGVPMIVCPTGFDQAGNAARVVLHGLGLGGVMVHKVDFGVLERELDAALDSSAIQEVVHRFREQFLEIERDCPSVRFVQSLLDSKPNGPPLEVTA